MIQFGRGSQEIPYIKKSRSRIYGFKDFTEKPTSRYPGRGILSSVKSVIKSFCESTSSQSLSKLFQLLNKLVEINH